MKHKCLKGCVGLFLLSGVARADEGRMPIFQPTTITSSGSYVVTRDITVASGNVVTIQASDVDLDLNGKTIQSTAISSVLIAIDTGASTVRVKNGELIGGASGIQSIGGAGPILLEVENVALLNQASDAINLGIAGEVSVSDCSFRNIGNNGINVISALSTSAANIAGNVFSNVGNRTITTSNLRTVAILHNVISDASIGIQLSSPPAAVGGSDLVQGNVLERKSGLISPGDGILVLSLAGSIRRTALVLDNVVSGFSRGLAIFSSDGVRIAGNIVHRGVAVGASNGDGIVLTATQTLLEDNQVQGNSGCGILFTVTASGSAYRNNMLRGNTGGAVCNSGVGNTDEGGNLP